MFPHGVQQYAHDVPGTADMSAGGIVPAFHHYGHAQHQVIAHLHDVPRLQIHLPLQLAVEFVQRIDMSTVRCVVRNDDPVAADVISAGQSADGEEIVFVSLPVKMRVLRGFLRRMCILLQPGKQQL